MTARMVGSRSKTGGLRRGDRCIWHARTGRVQFERELYDFVPSCGLFPELTQDPVIYKRNDFEIMVRKLADRNTLNAKPEFDDGLSVTIILD